MSAVVTKLKRDRITIGLLRFISEAYVNKREENNAVQRGLESVRHMVTASRIRFRWKSLVKPRTNVSFFTLQHQLYFRPSALLLISVLPDRPRDTHGAGLVGGLP